MNARRLWFIPRPRFTVRTILAVVAIVALGLGANETIHRRSQRFQRLAAYHLQCSDVLIEQAGGSLECIQLDENKTFQQSLDKIYSNRSLRQYAAFKASNYHDTLFDKYRLASVKPWWPIEHDPPPPPMANPGFSPDGDYLRTVQEWDDNSLP